MTTREKNYTADVRNGHIEIMNQIEALQSWQNENSDKDLQDNENYREPLCVDTQLVMKIVLSMGGPEDGFKLFFNILEGGEKELSHGVYYRADWGEYKESSLFSEEAETVFDFYLGGYIE